MAEPTENTPEAAPEAAPVSDDAFLEMVRENNKATLAGGEQVAENLPETPAEPDNVDADPQEPKDPEIDLSAEGDDIKVNPLEGKSTKQKKSKEDNIKGLRTALSSEREKREAIELDLKTAQEKLEQSGDVEQLRSELEARDKRIEELQKYEGLLGLKQSKEFREKYIEGVDTLLKNAQDIAKDYGVGDDILKQAIKTGNRKELNALLLQHFDSVAIGEMYPIIKEMQGLLIEKREVEQNPVQAHEQLIKAAQDKEKAEQVTARKLVTASVQEGWVDVTNLYSAKEGGVEALQEIVGNDEHNQNRAKLLEESSAEFGQLMGTFVQNGLRKIPLDQSKAVAARFQLAAVAGQMIEENIALKERIAVLEKKQSKTASYRRPMSAGSNSKQGGDAPPKELKGKEIAAHVFQKATQ